MFREYVLKILGWCPKVSFESTLVDKNKKVSTLEQRASLYARYITVLLIVGMFLYAANAYFFTGPPKIGQEFAIWWSTTNQVLVYDLNLPTDLNYIDLWGTPVYFQTRLNISEYINGTNPEIITLQFHNKQNIRSWIDTLKEPNLLRNILKVMFDMSREDFNREDPLAAFNWRPETAKMEGYVKYLFTRSMDASNNFITISKRDAGGTSISPMKVWDLVIKVPFTGTEYELTFTRYPKL